MAADFADLERLRDIIQRHCFQYGGSVLKAIDAVEALGARIALIALLVERSEGGAEALHQKGYDVAWVFLADEKERPSISEAYLERMERVSNR